MRHGESIGNLIVEDMPDGELTELGRQQAMQVREGLKGLKLDHIVCSPLMRAIETASPLAIEQGLPIEIWKNTYEVRNKGPYRGPSSEKLRSMYPDVPLIDDIELEGWYCSGDETEAMATARAQEVYAELRRRYEGKRVVIFAHSGFNRHLLYAALGISWESNTYFHQSNGSIYWLTVTQDRTTVNYIGETKAMQQD